MSRVRIRECCLQFSSGHVDRNRVPSVKKGEQYTYRDEDRLSRAEHATSYCKMQTVERSSRWLVPRYNLPMIKFLMRFQIVRYLVMSYIELLVKRGKVELRFAGRPLTPEGWKILKGSYTKKRTARVYEGLRHIR
jgi:hypothetical protein